MRRPERDRGAFPAADTPEGAARLLDVLRARIVALEIEVDREAEARRRTTEQLGQLEDRLRDIEDALGATSNSD